MRFFAPVRSYLPQAIIPVGAVCYIVWLLLNESNWDLSNLKDRETLWIAAIAITTMCILFFYAALKRLRMPLFEVYDDFIIVNETMRPRVKILWSTVTSLKRHWFTGYKLAGINRDVSLPIGLLAARDREKIISVIESHLEKAKNPAPRTTAESGF